MKQKTFNELFMYANGHLYWQCSGKGRKPSKLASCPNGDGYLVVRVYGKLLKIHRVIWEMFYGAIPKGLEIDHKNHNRSDNLIENLRLVSSSENKRNASKRVDNTSNQTGVYFYKPTSKWMAYIGINGKKKNLGYFTSIEEATEVRKSAEVKYGYFENHGE